LDNTNTENKPAENPVPESGSVGGQPASPEGAQPENDPCRQQITVEIPVEEVTEREEALVQQYSKQARVPGFRKGKVPASVVRNRFAEQLREELLELLVPEYFRVAVMSGGFRPISAPSITDLKANPGEAIRFTASFDVMPEIQLGDYKGIRIEKQNIEISDDDVDSEIKALQERQASYDPVEEDRDLADGDFAQVAFTATPKEDVATEGEPQQPKQAKPAEPVKMDDVLVEIGSPTTVPEFSQHLRGVKAGEEKEFEVTYASDFHDRRLAGKTFSYHVKVNSIKKKTLPELSDDFAKELSPEIETLEKLKEMIRENLREQRKHEAEHEAKEKLIDALVEKHEFPVPRSMVEHHIGLRLERGLRALAAQGMRKEDIKRMDFRRLSAAQEPAAIKEAKSGLLLHKIADAENIQVSDEELDREIASLAYHTQQSPEDVRKQLTQEDGLERIRARLRGEKALNFLYEQAG
jgi:trigger factor